MKVRLIIESRGWAYRLHVSEQQPGRYYASLRTPNGARLEKPVATGPFTSLDVICGQAPDVYRALVAMHAAAPSEISTQQPQSITA